MAESHILREHGSGIVKRAVYDVSTNQLVGLTLPLNRDTGMPVTSKYITRTLKDFGEHMKETLSSLVYVAMAQPVKLNCPPLILHLYGTDNKFTSSNVVKRWDFTKAELEK